MGFVPLRDLRRRDADHADPEPARRPGFVGEVALDDNRRGEPGRAVGLQDIAADNGKARLRIGALQRLEAIVEFMVAERGDRVVEPVHGGNHRMDGARVADDRGGSEVAKRRALENVAVVEQEAVGAFAPRPGDQRGGAREADRVIRAITIVIVRIEIGMQIGQANKAQAQPGRGACERGFHVVLAATFEAVTKVWDGGERTRAPGFPVKEAFADALRRSASETGSSARSWGPLPAHRPSRLTAP